MEPDSTRPCHLRGLLSRARGLSEARPRRGSSLGTAEASTATRPHHHWNEEHGLAATCPRGWGSACSVARRPSAPKPLCVRSAGAATWRQRQEHVTAVAIRSPCVVRDPGRLSGLDRLRLACLTDATGRACVATIEVPHLVFYKRCPPCIAPASSACPPSSIRAGQDEQGGLALVIEDWTTGSAITKSGKSASELSPTGGQVQERGSPLSFPPHRRHTVNPRWLRNLRWRLSAARCARTGIAPPQSQRHRPDGVRRSCRSRDVRRPVRRPPSAGRAARCARTGR
jgi:hypothetical protein